MVNIKYLTFLFSIILTFSNCSKNDGEIHSDVLASIESPHLINALREQSNDFEGQISENDITSLTELKLTLNVSKLGYNDCKWSYDYNLHENNLLSGLNEFKNLKKLILVLRQELNNDEMNFGERTSSTFCFIEEDLPLPILVQIENLSNLEELYYSSHLRNVFSTVSLEVKNCPKLKKIGTSNPFVGVKDYPQDEIVTMDGTNFSEENPSYEKFEPFVGLDESGVAGDINSLMYNTRIHLENLPALESLHLFHASLRGITQAECPNLKKLFYFKKRGDLGQGGWLFDPALAEIEEFYFDFQYYEPFASYDPQVLDLSSFLRLNRLYYKFWVPGEERNSVQPGSLLRIQNGNNVQNNLKITIDFTNYNTRGMVFQQGDSKRFALCLDDEFSEELKNSNISVKSEHGVEGAEALTFSCE